MATVTNKKNSVYYQIDNTKAVVPASSTKTGTIVSSDILVTGTNTLFLSEVKPGDWLADIVTNNEVRRVQKVFDNTTLSIDSAFTAALVGAAVVVVRSRAKQVSLGNAGGADGTLDGVVMEAGETVTYPKSNKNPDGSDFIDPIIVDATGTRVKVSITK